MGNIFTAFKNRTPMVVTAGQQARSILPFEPFLSARRRLELPKPYVKWSVEPARAADVPLAIARAYYIAMTPPRGPVLRVDPCRRLGPACGARGPARRQHATFDPIPTVLGQIGAMLDASLRPAFVVGGAVDRDGAWDEVVRLAERHKAPRVGGADDGPLRLSRGPSAVRGLPAGHAREDRRTA